MNQNSQLDSKLLCWFTKVRLQHQLLLNYEQPIPNSHELNEFISNVRLCYPHLDIEQVVQRLYDAVKINNDDPYIVPPFIYSSVQSLQMDINQIVDMKLEPKVQDAKQDINLLKIGKEIINIKQNLKYNRSDSQFSLGLQSGKILRKYDLQNVPEPYFKNQKEEFLYKSKQVIIQAFVANGYGMVPFREYLQSKGIDLKLQYKQYAGLVTSVATQAFRAIQHFLRNNCGIMIYSLSKPEIKILYSIILNLKDFTSDQNYKIYKLFMLAQYGLCPANSRMTAMSAYKTYQAIVKLLVTRTKEMFHLRNNDKQKISVFRQSKEQLFCRKIKEDEVYLDQNGQKSTKSHILMKWGLESQFQLARIYIQEQDLLKIRVKYQQIYGKITMFQDVNVLRRYVYKIIRKSLRNAQQIVRKYVNNFTSFVQTAIKAKQQQKYFEYVLSSRELVDARILLCKFYICKQKSFDLISRIAESIHKGLELKLGSEKSVSKYTSSQ